MDFYETLGVEKDASQDEIKKAYRAKATQMHPDAGGNAEEFAELAKAYEVLSDDDSRAKYDRGELDGIDQHTEDLATIAALAEAAIGNSEENPVRWICDHIDRTRGKHRSELQTATKERERLEKARENLAESSKETDSLQIILNVVDKHIEEQIEAERINQSGIDRGDRLLELMDGVAFKSAPERAGAALWPDNRIGPGQWSDRFERSVLHG